MTTRTAPEPAAAGSPAPTTEAPTTEAPTAAPAQPAAPATAGTSTLSILSLVFSIVAIPTGFSMLAIAGVVLGFVGHRREPAGRTLATWGIVVGFVALFWWLAVVGVGLIGAAVTWPFWLGGFALL